MLGRSNKSVFGAAKEAEITHFFRKLNKNVKKTFLFFFFYFFCAISSATLYGTSVVGRLFYSLI